MKRIVILLLPLMLTPLLAFPSVDHTAATSIVNSYIVQQGLGETTLLYTLPNSVSNYTICLFDKTEYTTPNSESYVYFLDEHPLASWCHPCRYFYVDVMTGIMEMVCSSLPPLNLSEWNLFPSENVPVWPLIQPSPSAVALAAPSRYNMTRSNHCYAILVNGGYQKRYNHTTYWNDCSLMYRTLSQTYGYPDDHILVLFSDGTDPAEDAYMGGYPVVYVNSPSDLDNDGDVDILYPATVDCLRHVCDSLSSIITSDDFLFVYTTGHGILSSTGVSSLCMWDSTLISAPDFANEFGKIPAGQMLFVMDQCFGGAFIDYLSDPGRVIVTSTSADEPSWLIGPYNYMAYYWDTAMNGCFIVDSMYYHKTPPEYADFNQDGYVSFKEAFDHLKPSMQYQIGFQHPQYYSRKPHLGEFMTMLGNEICYDTLVYGKTVVSNDTIYGCNVTLENVSAINDVKLHLEAIKKINLNNIHIHRGSVLSTEKQ